MDARRPALRIIAALGLTLLAARGGAQDVPPGLILQDEFDLGGRYNMTLGAGARALGMGGAFMARADDATAASWNPAGLSYLLRPELSLVGVVNSARIDSDAEIDVFRGAEPDFVAVTYPLPSIAGAAQISFQRVIPFSGHRTIERPGSSLSALQGHGGIDVLALGTGWRVAPSLRVGATLNRWTNGFHQVLTRERDEREGRNRNTYLEEDLDFRAWNLILGFIWSPRASFNVGAVAKTPFSARARLSKRRVDRWFTTDGELLAVNPSDHAEDNLRIEFPAAYGIGASWRLRSSLTLSADYTRSAWSEARIHGFFALKAGPAEGPNPEPDFFDQLPYPLLDSPQADTAQLRMGAEYVVIRKRLKWPLRAGYIVDQQLFSGASEDPPLFGAFTLGTGIILGPMLLDVAYLRESGSVAASAGAPARHKAQRFFVSLIYRQGSVR